MSSLISSLAWVRRGVAKQQPAKYNLDDKELSRVAELARIELEDAKTELARAEKAAQEMGERNGEDEDEGMDEGEEEGEGEWEDEPDADNMDEDAPKPRDPNDLSEYNLDDYDNEESQGAAMGAFSNIKGLTYYRNNEEDPYITLKEDEEEEKEELEVLPTDNMIVTAKTEEDVSQLEIYVYDDAQENLYVHHDIMLPAFPLCLEWLDFPPASSSTDPTASASDPASSFGNYIAVGTFEPEIEIWSLDVVDGLYPDALLGRPDESKLAALNSVPLGTGKKKKKKLKPRTVNAEYHVDAVLSLSWNRAHRNLLASGSADKTVKLWDLNLPSTSGAIRSFDVHGDKVQAVEWNPVDPTVLLTGGFDKTVRTFDSRSPAQGVGAKVAADVEVCKWDPWNPHNFYVSTEDGLVQYFDARNLSTLSAGKAPSNPTSALYMLSAHDGAVSALDISPHVRGCVATGGTDKLVKIWNVAEAEGGKRAVSMVTSRDLNVGKVFSVSFSPDDPLVLAAAGSKAKLQVWDVGTNPGARKAFAGRVASGAQLRERSGEGVIGVESDDEGLSDGDD